MLCIFFLYFRYENWWLSSKLFFEILFCWLQILKNQKRWVICFRKKKNFIKKFVLIMRKSARKSMTILKKQKNWNLWNKIILIFWWCGIQILFLLGLKFSQSEVWMQLLQMALPSYPLWNSPNSHLFYHFLSQLTTLLPIFQIFHPFWVSLQWQVIHFVLQLGCENILFC